jgi:hypothetical protein
MYQALEVQNIDEILPPPPPPPQPQDPAIENGLLISGQTPQAFAQQDHDAHLTAHIALLEIPMLQNAPPVLSALFTHTLQHVSFKAREQVDKELAQITAQPQQQMQQLQLMAQAGAVDPMVAQQQMAALQQQGPTQFTPEQIESRVAQVEEEMIKDLMLKLSYSPEGDQEDPLVKIRMQELSIKQMEAQHKAAMDQANLELEGARLEQRAVTDAARLDLQEEVADNRNAVNQERIDVQREAMLRRT